VQGTITRIERTPRQLTYDPDVRSPVSNAVVYVREDDVLFDDEYAEVLTDATAIFDLFAMMTVCLTTNWRFMCVCAERSGGTEVVEVE
jgi:hypothetical protein